MLATNILITSIYGTGIIIITRDIGIGAAKGRNALRSGTFIVVITTDVTIDTSFYFITNFRGTLVIIFT
jgi:hypothetical protein